ncbi:hypothetical protein PFISCL1PPCAC_20756, partial [Pristionchus fissidentatus]
SEKDANSTCEKVVDSCCETIDGSSCRRCCKPVPSTRVTCSQCRVKNCCCQNKIDGNDKDNKNFIPHFDEELDMPSTSSKPTDPRVIMSPAFVSLLNKQLTLSPVIGTNSNEMLRLRTKYRDYLKNGGAMRPAVPRKIHPNFKEIRAETSLRDTLTRQRKDFIDLLEKMKVVKLAESRAGREAYEEKMRRDIRYVSRSYAFCELFKIKIREIDAEIEELEKEQRENKKKANENGQTAPRNNNNVNK